MALQIEKIDQRDWHNANPGDPASPAYTVRSSSRYFLNPVPFLQNFSAEIFNITYFTLCLQVSDTSIHSFKDQIKD